MIWEGSSPGSLEDRSLSVASWGKAQVWVCGPSSLVAVDLLTFNVGLL